MSTSIQPLSNDVPPHLDFIQKIAIIIGTVGLSIMLIAWFGVHFPDPTMWTYSSLLLITVGVIMYSWRTYSTKMPGISNDGNMFSSISNRGVWAWIATILITAFYVCLYLYPQYLGLNSEGNTGLIKLFDPISQAVKGSPASQWFVYGTLYTIAILIFGVRFIWKYRHNRYQVLRTISVMFFQLFFAFLIPEILEALQPGTAEKWFGKDMKNMWPLDYDFFYSWHIDNLSVGGKMGVFFLILGLLMIFVISPILTYLYGKRWYCSWVCGCGGLAETAGDSFRHLSDKSLKAWKVERWLIHGILLFTFVMTTAVIYSYLGGDSSKYYLTRTSFTIIVLVLYAVMAGIYWFLQKKNTEEVNDNRRLIIFGSIIFVCTILLANFFMGSGNAFFINAEQLKKWYGLYVGAIFSGIIGVGFYPIMGSRVWCRFGCPMAALLGIQQKLFSRFRITTNGGQCISCGNCSTYCEMGIDVRSYAQKGQNIVRASCVGCGVCSAVCPRGVLKLENGSADVFSKTEQKRTVHILESEVGILS